VEAALQGGHAVVALESTLITHGLPCPSNVETALAMEAAIREKGAIPATIAILRGEIIVGLGAGQIEELGRMPPGSVRKCSRRDLPIALARRQTGATTVAATMVVAAQAGIACFATGGIGGVHRGQPQDVSADLLELGRSPVTVVSSGAKSILDLALTLEVLETQGVPILGYRCEHLPAFYARSSGLAIDQRIDSAQEAAQIMRAAAAIDARHGILVTVPVPAAQALSAATAEVAIAQATVDAQDAQISGNALTPFVLNRVSELTQGASRAANVALLVNNARVAAEIACAYSAMSAKES